MRLQQVAFVLHHPASAENVGAVARVVANFGLGRLVLVAPPAWDGPARSGEGTGREDALRRARRTARGAEPLLASAEVHADLRAALAGATWACGTSSRAVSGRASLSPRDLAAEVARRSEGGLVAVVFGQERRGLSDAELRACQAVCAIPARPEHPSLNLAQAAAVVAYELAAAAAARPTRALPPETARLATVEALFDLLRDLLGGVGFLDPRSPEVILAEWRRLLARAEATQREVETLTAAARALLRRLASR
jgi:tRNA/rRNA methyltransferase